MSIVRPLCVPKILKPRASPYRTLSSDAYSPPPRAPPSTSTSNNQSQYPPEATTTTPLLTPEQDDLLKSILRVDHAGELGANWIYRGQKWAMDVKGDTETSRQVEWKGMWDNERHHLKTLSLLVAQHRARPTLLYPIWQTMAFALGAGTGLMSKEAAMACTEAVETVIGEHYDDQLRELAPLLEKATATGEAPHPSIPLMTSILREFRDDELEHLDTAVEEGAQKAPGHSLLSAIIGVGCKAAINVCGKI